MFTVLKFCVFASLRVCMFSCFRESVVVCFFIFYFSCLCLRLSLCFPVRHRLFIFVELMMETLTVLVVVNMFRLCLDSACEFLYCL